MIMEDQNDYEDEEDDQVQYHNTNKKGREDHIEEEDFIEEIIQDEVEAVYFNESKQTLPTKQVVPPLAQIYDEIIKEETGTQEMSSFQVDDLEKAKQN